MREDTRVFLNRIRDLGNDIIHYLGELSYEERAQAIKLSNEFEMFSYMINYATTNIFIVEDDEYAYSKITLTHFEGALRALLKGKAVRRTDWLPGVYAVSKFGTLEDHQGSRVELRIGFDLDIEENLNTAWEILN